MTAAETPRTDERATLSEAERETARLWLYAHNGDEGGGLGGLWQMVGRILTDRLAAAVARAEAAEAKVAAVEALAHEWEGWAARQSTTRIDAFRDAAEHVRAALGSAATEEADRG